MPEQDKSVEDIQFPTDPTTEASSQLKTAVDQALQAVFLKGIFRGGGHGGDGSKQDGSGKGNDQEAPGTNNENKGDLNSNFPGELQRDMIHSPLTAQRSINIADTGRNFSPSELVGMSREASSSLNNNNLHNRNRSHIGEHEHVRAKL